MISEAKLRGEKNPQRRAWLLEKIAVVIVVSALFWMVFDPLPPPQQQMGYFVAYYLGVALGPILVAAAMAGVTLVLYWLFRRLWPRWFFVLFASLVVVVTALNYAERSRHVTDASYGAAVSSGDDSSNGASERDESIIAKTRVEGLFAFQDGNYEKALNMLGALAEQGDAISQAALGYMYVNGQGVPKDYEAALRWYTAAAYQGHHFAQANLGEMFRNGQGVPQDYVKALEWTRKAAEQGNVAAQFNLGLMYDFGHGTHKDFSKAAKWFREAAEQGHSEAQLNLGVMHSKGEGVIYDAVLAHKWFNLSAAQGNERAIEYRNMIEEAMSSEEISEAQRLARERSVKDSK